MLYHNIDNQSEETETVNNYFMFNDKKLMLEGSYLADFISLMDNNYILIGASFVHAGDYYQLNVYDKNFKLVKTYDTEKRGEFYINNKTFVYSDCTKDEIFSTPDRYTQKLTTYAVTFENNTISQKEMRVENDTFCNVSTPGLDDY